ncbi:MAG: response regulator transcription factor [Proteobacteria bacterium]|nr:response regulator transcription factor [Pseudomonadota bacterium]
MAETRIIVADDHELLRDGLKSTLGKVPGYEVVGEAANGTDAMRLVEELRPDVVIMDVTMPGLDGISATKRIVEDFGTRVIVLSMHEEGIYAVNAFKAGAMAYVLKGTAAVEVLQAIEEVMRGARYASPSVANELLGSFVDILQKDLPIDPIDTLTAREKEILKHIASGNTNKEIGEKLFIALSTVKTHRVNIMTKLDVHDVAGLTRIAIAKGLG